MSPQDYLRDLLRESHGDLKALLRRERIAAHNGAPRTAQEQRRKALAAAVAFRSAAVLAKKAGTPVVLHRGAPVGLQLPSGVIIPLARV